MRIQLLLMDRAFFTTECINLLKGRGVDFITPCVCNERVQAAIDSLGKEGVLPFWIHDNDSKKVWHRSPWSSTGARGKRNSSPSATNIQGSVKKLVRTIPKEYRKRWGIETSFRKVKEVCGRTLSPSPAIRLAYFMTAMILYNVWQAINLMLTIDRQAGAMTTTTKKKKNGWEQERRGYRITMPFMVTIICAHLNGKI